MEKIYDASNGAGVYIGDDQDYLKVKDNPKFKTARVCKDGPDGHRDTLGYTTKAAPQNKHYLSITKHNRISINIIDADDPNFIPFDVIKISLDYIKQQLDAGYNVLIACNRGESRAPSIGLAFLRFVGDMPHNFHTSESIFKGIYNKFNPSMGIRQVLRSHWSELENLEIADGK